MLSGKQTLVNGGNNILSIFSYFDTKRKYLCSQQWFNWGLIWMVLLCIYGRCCNNIQLIMTIQIYFYDALNVVDCTGIEYPSIESLFAITAMHPDYK